MSAHKPASFWREKRETVVSFSSKFSKNFIVLKQVTITVAVLGFIADEKAHLAATKTTEQPKLLTKSKMNRPINTFSKYFE